MRWGRGTRDQNPRPLAKNARRTGHPSQKYCRMKTIYTWSAILAIVFASVVGDVLLARAMRQVGDVGALWRRAGLGVVIGRTLGNPNFLLGVTAMAVAFFSLLFALSWGDVSLVAPAAASLTFIGNAVAAKIFLHEKSGPAAVDCCFAGGGGGGAAGGLVRGAPDLEICSSLFREEHCSV